MGSLRIILPIFLVLMLGCTTATQPIASFAYRPNTSVSTKNRDALECSLETTQAVPQDTRIATTPTYRSPTQLYCSGYGCTTTGGQVYGGQVYSYDANDQLKVEYRNQCMAAKGYTISQLPTCPPRAVPSSLAAILSRDVRPPRPGACVHRVTSITTNVVYADEIN